MLLILTSFTQNHKSLFVISSAVWSIISTLLGGFDIHLNTLLILITFDYLTGILVALVFQNSQKTKDGKLSSKAMTRGLIKKFFIICIVCVMKQLDDYLGINYLRNLFIVSFIINELTSLYENANSAGIINDDIKKLFDKVFTILRKDEN